MKNLFICLKASQIYSPENSSHLFEGNSWELYDLKEKWLFFHLATLIRA